MVEKVKRYLTGDKVIWGVLIGLAIFSLLAVYSSTGTLAYKKMGGNTTYYLVRHGVILLAGFLLIYVVHLIPYKYYFQVSVLLLVISLLLLIVTLIAGTRMNEASRWLTLPGLGFTLQTSDVAKMSLMMYLARELSLLQDDRGNFRKVMKTVGVPLLLTVLLIAPANLSTAMILFMVSLVLMFIARVKIRVLLGMVGVTVVLGALALLLALATGQKGRITTWQHRIENYLSGNEESGENYQVQQARIAVATGGLFGKKPGKSTQRNFLPHPYSDFIFAIIVEEYGLVFGAIPIVLAYLILLFRAGVIIRKCERTFPAFLVAGMTLLIVTQAFVNMGVAVSLFPVTGQTLPLVSMGGSSMLVTAFEMGVILNVSRTVALGEEEADLTERMEYAEGAIEGGH